MSGIWPVRWRRATTTSPCSALPPMTNPRPGQPFSEGVRLVRGPNRGIPAPGALQRPVEAPRLAAAGPGRRQGDRGGTHRGPIRRGTRTTGSSTAALGPASRACVPLVMTLHDYSHICVTKRLMEMGRQRCHGPLAEALPAVRLGALRRRNGAVTMAANAWSARRRTRVSPRRGRGQQRGRPGRRYPGGAMAAQRRPEGPRHPELHSRRDRRRRHRADAAGRPLLFAGDLSPDRESGCSSTPTPGWIPRRRCCWSVARRPGSWQFPAGAQWLGPRPHAEVVGLFNSARAVIVPSVWADPCPTVVLEAMAAGRPVVAAASGNPRHGGRRLDRTAGGTGRRRRVGRGAQHAVGRRDHWAFGVAEGTGRRGNSPSVRWSPGSGDVRRRHRRCALPGRPVTDSAGPTRGRPRARRAPWQTALPAAQRGGTGIDHGSHRGTGLRLLGGRRPDLPGLGRRGVLDGDLGDESDRAADDAGIRHAVDDRTADDEARTPGLVSTAALVNGTTSGVAALICAFVLPPDFIGLPGIGGAKSASTCSSLLRWPPKASEACSIRRCCR